MSLYKLYVPTEKPNEFIKFTMNFNKDTYHWATGQAKEKGYQLTATIVEKSNMIESFSAFSGFYKIIYPIGRQSKKRLKEAISMFYNDIEQYLNFFRDKGYKIKNYEKNTNG